MTNYFDTDLETINTEGNVVEPIARLSSDTIHTVIDLLFPSLEYASKLKKLYNYIQRKFATNHSCALYSISKDFSKLCANLDLAPGSREVIITSGGSIFYTPNFTSEPIPVY